jgi:hypothetical protein
VAERKAPVTERPKTTAYFREQVLVKRPYLKVDWCMAVLEDFVEREVQAAGRIRFWGYVDDLPGKALRVVTLEDGRTLHNAFPDSGYARRNR